MSKILKADDIMQEGDIIHFLDGTIMIVSGLAGDRCDGLYLYDGINKYVERPDPEPTEIDRLRAELKEANKLIDKIARTERHNRYTAGNIVKAARDYRVAHPFPSENEEDEDWRDDGFTKVINDPR